MGSGTSPTGNAGPGPAASLDPVSEKAPVPAAPARAVAIRRALAGAFAASVLAGVVLALFEGVRSVLAGTPGGTLVLAGRRLVLAGVMAVPLVLVVELAASLLLVRSAGPVDPRRRIVGRSVGLVLVVLGLVAPLSSPFCAWLVSGPRARASAVAPWVTTLCPAVLGLMAGVFVLASATLLGGHPVRRRLAALALVLAAVGLEVGNARILPGLYRPAHDALALATLGVLAVALRLLLGPKPPRALAASALIGVLALVLIEAAISPSMTAKVSLRDRTLHGDRLLRLERRLGLGASSAAVGVPAGDVAFAEARRAEGVRAAARRSELAARVGREGIRHLLWITIDTMRGDRLSRMRAGRSITPVLDELGARSAVFEAATAQFPITLLSFQSMFYGRYPTATPVYRGVKGWPDRAEGSRTLAQVLGDAGFRTVSVPAIDQRTLIDPVFSVLGTGFKEINPGKPIGSEGLAPDQVRSALEVIASPGPSRFFLWVHFMEPHAPYLRHDGFDFGADAEARYDSEVAYVDAAVGEILYGLRRHGLDASTAVVVNADHGEAFGEHGVFRHGSTLYEEQIRVPLVVHVPGLAPRRVRRPVENVDLMPTLLDVLGVEAKLELQGRSLVPELLDGDDAQDPWLPIAFAELPEAVPELAREAANRQSFRYGPLKLIVSLVDELVELYDLDADPGETRNLAEERPEEVRRLRAMARAMEAETLAVNRPGSAVADGQVDVARALRARIAAASPKERRSMLGIALREGSPELSDLLRERLDDGREDLGIRAWLLREAGKRLGAEIVPRALGMIREGAAFGAIAGALDALLALPELALDAGSRDAIAAVLSRQVEIARLAALVLARVGDERGRALLAKELDAPDHVVAWRSAAGLALLGDASVEGRLLLGLDARVRGSAPAAILGISALSRIRSRAALGLATHWAGDEYLATPMRRALVPYLASIGDEDVVPALSHLLAAWDPVSGAEAAALAARLFGPERTKRLREAGERLRAGIELAGTGDRGEARREFQRARDLAGGARPGAQAVLFAARMAFQEGDRGAVEACVKELREASASADFVAAAEALLRADRGAPPEVLVASAAPLLGTPFVPGGEGMIEVRLRAIGQSPVLGGRFAGALALGPVFTNEQGRVWVPFRPIAIPDRGILPGEELVLAVTSGVPPKAGSYRASVGGFIGGEPRDLAAAPAGSFSFDFAGDGVAGTGPIEYRGETLRSRLWIAPGMLSPTIESDGAVSYLAADREAWLFLPILAPRTEPVFLDVDIELVGPDPAGSTRVGTWHSYDAFPDPGRGFEVEVPLPLNGERRILPGRFDPDRGRPVRLLRFQPGDGPHLFRIHAIRVR